MANSPSPHQSPVVLQHCQSCPDHSCCKAEADRLRPLSHSMQSATSNTNACCRSCMGSKQVAAGMAACNDKHLECESSLSMHETKGTRVFHAGEKWHYAPMASQLAQAGIVTCVLQYSLYPDALAPQMVDELSQALTWTFNNISKLGGNPKKVLHDFETVFAGLTLTNRLLSLKCNAS